MTNTITSCPPVIQNLFSFQCESGTSLIPDPHKSSTPWWDDDGGVVPQRRSSGSRNGKENHEGSPQLPGPIRRVRTSSWIGLRDDKRLNPVDVGTDCLPSMSVPTFFPMMCIMCIHYVYNVNVVRGPVENTEVRLGVRQVLVDLERLRVGHPVRDRNLRTLDHHDYPLN